MIDTINYICKLYSDYSGIIYSIVAIIGVGITKIINKVKRYIHAKRLKTILELVNNTTTEYTVSFFDAMVWSSKIDNKTINLVPHSESDIPIFIVNILNISRYNSDIRLCILKNGQYKINSTSNRFVCGGPFTNPDTYNIFMKYFPYIKFPCSSKNYNEAKNKNIIQVIDTAYKLKDTTSSLRKIYYTKDKKFIEFDTSFETVIFMSRLKEGIDFEKKHGTVHVIFGLSAESTAQAFLNILNNTIAIYDMTKKYKNTHYAFFIKMSHNKEIDFKNSIDITDTIIV